MDLLVTIDKLIPDADPEGLVHAHLLRLRTKVQGNVMLGPADRKFLQRLLQIQKDNIECRYLDQRQGCKIPKVGVCSHLVDFKKCPYYRGQRPQTRGNPLSEL